ncbi:MAG: RNA polymerase sporulation sigma factor SigK [Ruminococcus sp.]|nr:RNA polymerase sporulation sigma factor SigK [Ruminococcus sp.]
MFGLLSFLGQYICFFLLHVCGNGTFPKPLSSKEEKEFLTKAKDGDVEARNKLVEHNLRLVAHIIKKYYSSRNDQDDLVSIGTIGLIKAVNTFDINKNIKLSSYASRCIENEILMYFRNLKKSSQDISLNEAIDMDKDGNPLSLFDVLSTEDNILDNINKKLNLKKIYEYIDSELDPREKQVIILRYGLNGDDPITQREVADILGVSRSYISRIETKALKNLRRKYERSSNL